MKSQHELEAKWSELTSALAGGGPVSALAGGGPVSALAGGGPVTTQSRSNYEWMLAQKELLEWVLS